MNGWLLVLLAGALEIVWAAALKASDGFQRPVPALLGVACAALSLFLLSLALRSIPVSVAYAIWVATGCSFSIPIICSSVNREGRIVWFPDCY